MASENCSLGECGVEGSNSYHGNGLADNAKGQDEQLATLKEDTGRTEGGAAVDESASSSPSKTAPGQPIEEDDVDLSCEYCGIALFVSFEDKLQHLETTEHWEKVIQICGLPSDDDCYPFWPLRPKVRERLDSDGSFNDGSETSLYNGIGL